MARDSAHESQGGERPDGGKSASATGDGGVRPEAESDAELTRIVDEEERVLARVKRTLEARRTARRAGPEIDYDAELLALRDQIQEARLEDIPPLVEEMERLQQVAARRQQVVDSHVDLGSPYFGRLVLDENDRKREVLIGRATFLDPSTGIRIVDWRDAPVSRIYYRYEEGDDYEENFGGRDVEGEVLVRRNLSIASGVLRRIGAPQGTFVRTGGGEWRRAGASSFQLRGGQGTAMRPEAHHRHRPGRLGTGSLEEREDRHLSEITALIDPRQFELISKPTAGLVLIQGGAGSGKTTIGLHRLAYLAFQDPQRFRSDKMLVVVFNDALVRYISRVLPALGIHGVAVTTYERWAQKLRLVHVPHLPPGYSEDTPTVVTRFKKHPVMLRLIADYAAELARSIDEELVETAKKLEGGGRPLRVWRESEGRAPAQRVEALRRWLEEAEGDAKTLPMSTRHSVERVITRAAAELRDIVGAWAEILTSREKLGRAFAEHAPDAFTERELDWVHSFSTRRCEAVIAWREGQMENRGDDEEGGENAASEPPPQQVGIDGMDEAEIPSIDREDDTLFLRLVELLRGGLTRKREALRYEHVFVDEAQDLSPVELSVVLDTVSKRQSVTLAGDVAQRLLMDNGFTDWRSTLDELGLEHVAVEPLRLSYRSTFEILEFASDVLGPLRAQASDYQATRHGAPVELFCFADPGEAVGFLAEALRELAQQEPAASVAVIARYPEQADLYFTGLRHGEVPNLRRISEQDFPFKAGVDVTDIRQVKGLEFDYVILVDVGAASYPDEDEARHLLHIGATRAAHQLWVVTTGTPSPLLPPALLKAAL